MTGLLISATTLLAMSAAAPAGAGDILIADFEGRNYAGWTATGEAFGNGPVRGTLPSQMAVSGFEGKGLVNSYLNGDTTVGTLTSPEFKIERKYLNFLLGGGRHPGETGVELLIGDKAVRTATGPDSERLDWHTWDVSEFAGQAARIRIFDRATGGWGHINIDQIVQSDTRQAEEIIKAPIYRETYRPQFHFTPRVNWINDPNGLVFYKGEYHLYFQHNPSGINWGNMTWGHAVSPDLVHWQQLEHALLPDKMGTMFSGSAVVDWDNTAGFQTGDEKVIVAMYTAAGGTSPESKGQPFTQCIAYSNDRGRTFTKYDKNPVVKHIAAENRDPKVIWHPPTKQWIMALYLNGEDFAIFASPDLKSWTRLQDLKLPGCGECPDFFPMPVEGDAGTARWVFTAANGRYLVGGFDGRTYKPEGGVQRVDYGKNYYAVQTYSDIPESDGRRIQIAWMNGGQYPEMPFNQQMSIPCAMTLVRTPEGPRVFRMPVKEIEVLRVKEHKWADQALKPGENPLAGVKSDLLDIIAEFEPGDAREFGLRFRGEAIAYAVADKRISALTCAAPLEPEKGRVRLRVLIDRTSIEVFGNDGRVSLTSCFLPRGKAPLEAYADGGTARIVSLAVHELRSAWK